MKTIWKINLVLFLAFVILLTVDECLERTITLGSKCSAERIVGKSGRELFDGQHVWPSKIMICPAKKTVFLSYPPKTIIGRKHPRMRIKLQDGIVVECLVGHEADTGNLNGTFGCEANKKWFVTGREGELQP
jgi:hypothetical protein